MKNDLISELRSHSLSTRFEGATAKAGKAIALAVDANEAVESIKHESDAWKVPQEIVGTLAQRFEGIAAMFASAPTLVTPQLRSLVDSKVPAAKRRLINGCQRHCGKPVLRSQSRHTSRET